MTAVVWGVDTDSPTALVLAALADAGADVLFMNGRVPETLQVLIRTDDRHPSGFDGWLQAGGRTVPFERISGVYVRPIEPELVPGVRELAITDPRMRHAKAVHDDLTVLTELLGGDRPGSILNRLSAMASNTSKPYQAQAIVAHGFSTPETLLTDDPDEALAFAAAHRDSGVVYKSASGVRSIVTPFDETVDRERLQRIRWCPVQFQEQLGGPDVRVHVVGDRTFAAMVSTTAVDYRYARRQAGEDAGLAPFELPDDVAARCVQLATALDLPFAGIDLKLVPDGRVACFEVNPSPGFTWYEHAAGLPISAAVAHRLTSAPQGGTP